MNLIPISTVENSTAIVRVNSGISEQAVDLEFLENLCRPVRDNEAVS